MEQTKFMIMIDLYEKSAFYKNINNKDGEQCYEGYNWNGHKLCHLTRNQATERNKNQIGVGK